VYTLPAAHRAAALVFKQLHQLDVAPEEFIPFGGQGEERFLGGIAAKYSVAGYQPAQAKQQFFANYLASIADPNVQIAYPGGSGSGVESEGGGSRRRSVHYYEVALQYAAPAITALGAAR
jgi:hypothetical protein